MDVTKPEWNLHATFKCQLSKREFVRELMGNNDLIVSSDAILVSCFFNIFPILIFGRCS